MTTVLQALLWLLIVHNILLLAVTIGRSISTGARDRKWR